MTGVLSLLAFEREWDLGHFVAHGLSALGHRGGSTRLVCWRDGERVLCEVGVQDSLSLRGSEAVAAAWVDEGELHTRVVEGRDSVTVFDRPSERVGEVAGAVERALASGRPEVELPKQLSAFADEDVPSFVTITSRGELVAWRSSSGLTPLAVGGYGFDMMVVSSETSAIDVLDAEVRRHLSPGEGVYATRRQVRLFGSGGYPKCGLCLFEMLYTARHDSVVDGVSVYDFRKMLGRRLGKYLASPVDLVTGVPETAVPYALGLSEAIKAPFEIGFVPSVQRSRSMLKGGIREKMISVHLKLNPVKGVLQGRSVAVVDDSMVTGSTLKTAVQLLRYRVGVRELHVLLASPKLVGPCPYGIVRLDPSTLISAHLESSLIERYLDVDSLSWLRDEDVESVALGIGRRFCGACFGKSTIGESR